MSPLGLKLNRKRIASTRPAIARMLRPRSEELAAVKYRPLAREDWKVSTPADQGLDPMLVAELYLDAAAMETLYGLLVVKNRHLVAERYFNEGAVDRKALLQSVSKSYISALVGIALQRGCLSSVDQEMIGFFPEAAKRLKDKRKGQITIRHLLQMRSGYPWEETDPVLWKGLMNGDLLPLVVDFPLVNDPGTAFSYSNLSSHWLGVIVARASRADLKSFAQEHLFSPLDVEIGEWITDKDGYYVGCAEMRFVARDMARFGLLYLDEGVYRGKRVLPAAWVRDSLRSYSKDAWVAQPPQQNVGRYFRDLGYGYQWWSANVGDRRFPFAWGHGGQLIILLHDLDIVIVATAKPFYRQHDAESWRHECAIVNLVGKFIRSLPR